MDFERDDGFILACTATLQSDVTIEADVEEDPDARQIPVRDFVGTWSRSTISPMTSRACVSRSRAARSTSRPANMSMSPLPGVEGSRAFSIANAPSDSGHVELQIRRVPGGAGPAMSMNTQGWRQADFQRSLRAFHRAQVARRPDTFSRRRHRRLQPALDDPRPARRGLCRADHAGAWREDGGRSLRPRRFRGAGRQRIRIFATSPASSSEPEDSAWKGERGFVHDVAKRVYGGQFEGNTAYLCGPPMMIEACIGALMQGRLFEKHIFTERFFTAKDCAEKPKSPLFKRL